MTERSYLFVPGDRLERFDKALRGGADAVIVDLEDAVAPAAKPSARDALAHWLGGAAAAPVMVRVNASGTPWFDDDLRLGSGAKLCIHPRQLATVHRGFLPDEAAIARARRVLAAAQAGGGAAVAVDGRMVDPPVLLRARRLLARAGLRA